MKFGSIMKQVLFALLLIAVEMKLKFVWEVVGVKRPIKNVKKQMNR